MTNLEIAARLEGVFTPVVTPFDRRGGVDEGAFRSNLQRYTGIGLSGVLVAGSNGEAPFLTDRERLRLIEVARTIIRPPELLIAGTGLEGTTQTRELSQEATARGADLVLVLPPAYYKPAMRPEVLEAHFSTIAESIRRPLLIYSIPQFTGFYLDPKMLNRLSRHPRIVGMKESSGNLDFVRRMAKNGKRRFHVLVGSAPICLESLKTGASGAILSQANFVPQLCVGLYEAFREGNFRTAVRLQKKLSALAGEITIPYGIAGVKAALDLRGYRGGNPRLPLPSVDEKNRSRIAAALKKASAGLDA